MTTRLHLLNPSLADSVRTLLPVQLQHLADMACRFAAAAGKVTSLQTEALGLLEAGDQALHRGQLIELLRSEEEALDNRYFAEREAGLPDWLSTFSSARLGSAIAYALEGSPESVCEAIYEACMTQEENSELLDAVGAYLRGLS